MQKFTRAITRELELGGERLALTFDEAGVSVRPVGSRKPPHTCSWASLLCHLTEQHESEPAAEAVTAALSKLHSGKAAPRTPKAAAPSKGDAVAAVLERLEKWLADNRPRFLRNLHPGATPEELTALEAAIGRPLPGDLRTLLSWHNGQGEDFAGALEGSWLLMSTTQIAAASKDLNADPSTGWRSEWIPFLDDDNGSHVCVDTSQDGNPVREYWLGNTDHPVTAPSLQAWLEAFVTAVERGDYVEDPERGRFLKRPSGATGEQEAAADRAAE